MSSAAVQQSTPQQYAQSPSGRDRFPPSAVPTASSSPSASRRNGKSGAGANGVGAVSPQHDPNLASYGPAPINTTTHGHTASPSASMSTPTRNQFYTDSTSTAIPAAALPLRTSSQQATMASVLPDERQQHGKRSTQHQSNSYAGENDRDFALENDRRNQPQYDYSSHQTREQPPNSARSERSRPPPVTSRSANAVGQIPVDASLPRENSAIINHIVVDDPQTDIAREKARVAESRPHNTRSDRSQDMPVTPGANPPAEAPVVPEPERAAPAQRSRQEHLKNSTSSHRKEVRFGDYILGQTLGEGEFGKVKMGWKKDSTVQVAIKLIRKESLAGNATRLPKIYREIAVLRELQHPNIVRLHEFVETERHMGIILEYASGGELFDYILNHRYLKDPAARRLFAQLVSGVGYLHKKGIVHRDLKLENLLLDRNRNIIITDFGFANTFNPKDELSDEVEREIGNKEFAKTHGFDIVGADGHRRGDLMQTSCGSPCYAAPELVVSDGLYTGRKVDVWSCGVILYAMLAGYLPFDDDPANPEGDNINLLYKYIVSTPLTFPEYVTPHARDLLRRILVADPRRRADLFEVARHSWLSEYDHVVGFIGSSSKSEKDMAALALQQDNEPHLGRSMSVREPTGRSPPMGTSASQKPPVSSGEDANAWAQQRDAKRRTVQVEYVAPRAPNSRRDESPAMSPSVALGSGRTRARDASSGPVEVLSSSARSSQPGPRNEATSPNMSSAPMRPGKDQSRPISDVNGLSNQVPSSSMSRPNTGGTLSGIPRLPSRGNSYSQPVAAMPTTTNVEGRFSQPKSSSGYIISSTIDQGDSAVRPASQQNLGQFQQQPQQMPRSHKRSSTLGSIGDRLLGRGNGKRNSQIQDAAPAAQPAPSDKRKYPPISMKNALHSSHDDSQPRMSTDSGRRPSFSFSRKNTDSNSGERRSSRRFSFLPSNFSMNSFSGKKDQEYDTDSRPQSYQRRPQSKGMAFGRGQSPAPSQSTTGSVNHTRYDNDGDVQRSQRRPQQSSQLYSSHGSDGRDARFDKALPPQPVQSEPPPQPFQRKQFRDDGYGDNLLQYQDPPERCYTPGEVASSHSPQPMNDSVRPGESFQQQQQQQYSRYVNNGYDQDEGLADSGRQGIRPQQRKFEDAYDQGHSGSSSGARRVMDFFRRRGKDRSAS